MVYIYRNESVILTKRQILGGINMFLNIINVIAIIVIPIVAVVVGQILQNKSEKRKDKMNVFTHLMSYRALGYSNQSSVNALNSIPIIFSDDKDVVENFNAYIKSMNIRPEDYKLNALDIETRKIKMLESMAKSLKYKNINWEVIQNPYLPQGLVDQIVQESKYKSGQVDVVNSILQQISKNNEQ